MKIEEVKEVVEGLGWLFNVDDKGEQCCFTISNIGCNGKDFTTEIITKKVDAKEFLSELYKIIENYDIDYETYLCLGPDGHGSNNAPYSIRDILEDNEEYVQELEKIYYEMRFRVQ